jgi:hypothetical protein
MASVISKVLNTIIQMSIQLGSRVQSVSDQLDRLRERAGRIQQLNGVQRSATYDQIPLTRSPRASVSDEDVPISSPRRTAPSRSVPVQRGSVVNIPHQQEVFRTHVTRVTLQRANPAAPLVPRVDTRAYDHAMRAVNQRQTRDRVLDEQPPLPVPVVQRDNERSSRRRRHDRAWQNGQTSAKSYLRITVHSAEHLPLVKSTRGDRYVGVARAFAERCVQVK